MVFTKRLLLLPVVLLYGQVHENINGKGQTYAYTPVAGHIVCSGYAVAPDILVFFLI